ncbi:CidA/LrgA family protein [Faucicola mancuniensis]|uniref:CidA/LrgA family protein n=1 Tax=Faucicola mancuniensis TaxID=1309795 RepID=UPI0028F02E71|nr:CidA/LrgA family protein [uncultured Moraxella sp.]
MSRLSLSTHQTTDNKADNKTNKNQVLQSFIKAILQIGIIGAVWGFSVVIKKFIDLPMSSGVLGLFILLALLFSKIIKLEQISIGSRLILNEFVLLFLPLMMEMIQYKDLFVHQGVQIVITVVIGTAMVMLGSAITFIFANRVKKRWLKKSKSSSVNPTQNI